MNGFQSEFSPDHREVLDDSAVRRVSGSLRDWQRQREYGTMLRRIGKRDVATKHMRNSPTDGETKAISWHVCIR
jgi:hypothetical protein